MTLILAALAFLAVSFLALAFVCLALAHRDAGRVVAQ